MFEKKCLQSHCVQKKIPRTKASSTAAETEGVSKTDASESVHGINDSYLDALLEEIMAAIEDQTNVA